MIYRFEAFELDDAQFELRRKGERIAIEPQVLSLLQLLIANGDRMVSKEEIVEKVWHGRVISDAAIAARIKSARKAIDDDGQQQRLLRTIHGKGFRFVGEVRFTAPVALGGMATVLPGDERPDALHERPSIAVLPFGLLGQPGPDAFFADAIADELIADLSRLRWLFVIARGSSFRFRDNGADLGQVGNALNVRYCLTGTVSFSRGGVVCSVELVEVAGRGVIWADRYEDSVENLHVMRREIVTNAVAALEIRIPLNEAHLARSVDPGRLGAWSAYHLGLDHMFRFNRADNQVAARLFARSLEADPDFARALAGKSFTHFQNAFLGYEPDHKAQADRARNYAEQALHRDRFDPFCHFNMGRSMWLDGDLHESVEWLDQATTISPSYAQAVYSKAWAQTLSGAAEEGEKDAQLALKLSPIDPLRYAMLATCALSHVIRGNFSEAAALGERAARSPGAHKHIAVIAAISTYLAEQQEASNRWISQVRQQIPDYCEKDFLRSFPFAPSAARETIERALADILK